MFRFYSPELDLKSSSITITDMKEIHHLRNVLRLSRDDVVSIFNGHGEEAQGVISNISSQEVSIKINNVYKKEKKTPRLILACALPKKGKFELIIEKATELGIDEIFPLITQRTEIVLKGDRKDKKSVRYQSIAINAAKQCRRSTVPVLYPPMKFDQTLNHLENYATLIIPSLQKDRKNLFETFQHIAPAVSIAFFIGPEGDFTPAEYALAKEKGCHAVSLGETVLKVETAAITVLACAQVYYSQS